MTACSIRCHKVAKQQRHNLTPSELASMQPRSDTDKADAEVEAITKSADYSLARSRHMHKQAMPDGILAGQTNGQPVNTQQHKVSMQGATHPKRVAAPVAQRKLKFDFSNHTENPMENSAGNIDVTQIDTKISTLRDSMSVSYTHLTLPTICSV